MTSCLLLLSGGSAVAGDAAAGKAAAGEAAAGEAVVGKNLIGGAVAGQRKRIGKGGRLALLANQYGI